MSVVFLELNVQIHGLNIEKEKYTSMLLGCLKETIEECLIYPEVNYRREFDSDVTVEVVTQAGEYNEKG